MNRQKIQILEDKKNFLTEDKNKLNFNLNRLALIFFFNFYFIYYIHH